VRAIFSCVMILASGEFLNREDSRQHERAVLGRNTAGSLFVVPTTFMPLLING
jgi:hypothetical protein